MEKIKKNKNDLYPLQSIKLYVLQTLLAHLQKLRKNYNQAIELRGVCL